jgi:DNA-binding GntR family transcriptional regulator
MRAYEDHRKIVSRIVAGDGEGAALAVRSHIHSVLELTPRTDEAGVADGL